MGRASPPPPPIFRPRRRHSLAGAPRLLVEPRRVDSLSPLQRDELRRDQDFARFPELVWLNRWPHLPFLALLGGMYAWVVCRHWSGRHHSHGGAVARHLFHQLPHDIFGTRRYLTTDASRNNWLLALITCGEGWHNNHHSHQNTANQGWFWWEVDFTFYALKLLSVAGVVRDLRQPLAATKYAFRNYTQEQRELLRQESRFGLAGTAEDSNAPGAARVGFAQTGAGVGVVEALGVASGR